jgi:hypothetical protein
MFKKMGAPSGKFRQVLVRAHSPSLLPLEAVKIIPGCPPTAAKIISRSPPSITSPPLNFLAFL